MASPNAVSAVRIRRLSHRPDAVTVLVVVIIVVCLVGPFLWPYPADKIGAGLPYLAPGWGHPMGTDDLGRDLLARILAGGRITLGVAGAATVVSLILGITWGVVAAARRGWVDEALMRTADGFMAIPQIVFALVCVAAFGATVVSLTIIVGFLLAPATARIVRSVTLAELTADYAIAAQACGLPKWRVLIREVLPNLLPTVAVQATINLASAIILEATLSFIGLGLQPPAASWGTLLLQGYGKIYNSAWLVLIPTIWIVATIWALMSSSDAMRSRARNGGGA